MRPAIFLDRDGTLTIEGEWITKREALVLVPGAAEGLRLLARAGFALVMVTNQSAVARGLIDEAELAHIHAHLADLLAAEGTQLDAVYWCPHHPTEGLGQWKRDCDCRKPKPGLVLRAARELELDLAHSWMIGDAARDIEAGWAAGVRGVLVATGKGASDIVRMRAARAPDHFAPDLLTAAHWILDVSARERASGPVSVAPRQGK